MQRKANTVPERCAQAQVLGTERVFVGCYGLGEASFQGDEEADRLQLARPPGSSRGGVGR